MSDTPAKAAPLEFASFREFYPYYLSEHANVTSRRLHFIGTTLVVLVLIVATWRGSASLYWLAPLCGYGFAWIGHYFFEHNRPATFKHPLYSLIGDFAMARDMLIGRIRW